VLVLVWCSSDGHLSIDVPRRVFLIAPSYGIFSIKTVYRRIHLRRTLNIIRIIMLFKEYIFWIMHAYTYHVLRGTINIITISLIDVRRPGLSRVHTMIVKLRLHDDSLTR